MLKFFCFTFSVPDPSEGRGLRDWPRLQPCLWLHSQSHLWGKGGELHLNIPRLLILCTFANHNLFPFVLETALPQIPHVKIGPEETPRLPYLRFASVTLYPSNEDLSLAIGAILRSFSYPSASLVCAKAECESETSALLISWSGLPSSLNM